MAEKLGTMCPLLQKKCVEHKCAWYVKLMGTNKNTGAEIEDWGCSVAWLPVLLIENANEARQTAASVDSLRNAAVRSEDATRLALINGMQQFRLEGSRDD
jgi:hypothetical protein